MSRHPNSSAMNFQHSIRPKSRLEKIQASLAAMMSQNRHQRSPPPLALSISVCLVTVWLLWACILPIKINGFIPLPPGYPWHNLRRNWVRVRFGYQIRSDSRRAAALPRYHLNTVDTLFPEIFVISLASTTERRESVQHQMTQQNIPFTWWDAVDGSAQLPIEEVRWYTRGRRLRDFLKEEPGGHEYRKVACDLSHLRLMHDMVAAGREVQIVLEDDVQFTNDNFLEMLNSTLHALPADWDVLWLNHGGPIQRKPSNLAGWVGPGVRMFLDNSATVGMVYKKTFALRILNDAQIGNKHIDNLMNDVGQLGLVRAYVADPPLVQVHEAGFASQIEIDER